MAGRLVAGDNFGDGIGLVAGPLLIASQTQDPLLVALAALLQRLPWLLFGLYAGALADRIDRRRLVVAVDLTRAAMLAVLTATLITDQVNVAVVLVAMFALGTGEVFADTATGTLLPTVVAKRDLGIGNARLMAGFLTMNQLAGPAVGATLFAAGMAWPFVTQLVLASRSERCSSHACACRRVERPAERPHVGRDILEGLRWTWGNAPVRTLTLTIVTFNITFRGRLVGAGADAMQRLGLGAVGFGLLTTVIAVGGLLSTATYDWLERHVSLANLMRVGLLIETLTHLGLAVTTNWRVAAVIMFVFGAHIFIWGTTSRTVRMRAVPIELQGRVGSLYSIGIFGGILVGQAIGGVIARIWGITAPFWFAFAASALILALIWREVWTTSRTPRPSADELARVLVDPRPVVVERRRLEHLEEVDGAVLLGERDAALRPHAQHGALAGARAQLVAAWPERRGELVRVGALRLAGVEHHLPVAVEVEEARPQLGRAHARDRPQLLVADALLDRRAGRAPEQFGARQAAQLQRTRRASRQRGVGVRVRQREVAHGRLPLADDALEEREALRARVARAAGGRGAVAVLEPVRLDEEEHRRLREILARVLVRRRRSAAPRRPPCRSWSCGRSSSRSPS